MRLSSSKRVRTARSKRLFARRMLVWTGVLSVPLLIVSFVFLGTRAKTTRIPAVQSLVDQPQPLRLVYPYSVIPGGVQSAAELQSALERDPVAAKHYQGFKVDSATLVRMPIEKLAYVSYRIGNQIYWTSRKVRLARDERVLTDGSHLIRSRCGNRISFERQPGESSKLEPIEAEMDLLAETFSDSTVISPWNEDLVIALPSLPAGKSTSVPAAPPGGSPRSTPAGSGGIAAFGLPRFVVALPSQAPPSGSLSSSLTTGTVGSVLTAPIFSAGGQLLTLNPAGGFPSQPGTPISSNSILPTSILAPGFGQKSLPLPAQGTFISGSPLIVEWPLTGVSNSPYNPVLNSPLEEITIKTDQTDQATLPDTPEPGTYLLTIGGLLLFIAILRQRTHVSGRS